MELTADFKILAQGQDITNIIKTNLISIELKDEDGQMADEVTISISSIYKRPRYGDELEVFLGYKETGLVKMGTFKVQTSTIINKHSMKISATGVDFSGNLKMKKSREFLNITLKELISKIANEHSLKYVCDVDIFIPYIVQEDKSDLAFLQELAKENNLIFSIKNSTIICVFKKQEALKYTINYNELIDISITHSNKTKYKSAKVVFRDTKDNQDKEVVILNGEPQLRCERSCKDEDEAKRVGLATLTRANKGTIQGELTILFKPIFAGGILNLTNTTDDGEYSIVSVCHTLDTNGFITNLNFEK